MGVCVRAAGPTALLQVHLERDHVRDGVAEPRLHVPQLLRECLLHPLRQLLRLLRVVLARSRARLRLRLARLRLRLGRRALGLRECVGDRWVSRGGASAERAGAAAGLRWPEGDDASGGGANGGLARLDRVEDLARDALDASQRRGGARVGIHDAAAVSARRAAPDILPHQRVQVLGVRRIVAGPGPGLRDRAVSRAGGGGGTQSVASAVGWCHTPAAASAARAGSCGGRGAAARGWKPRGSASAASRAPRRACRRRRAWLRGPHVGRLNGPRPTVRGRATRGGPRGPGGGTPT